MSDDDYPDDLYTKVMGVAERVYPILKGSTREERAAIHLLAKRANRNYTSFEPNGGGTYVATSKPNAPN